MTALVVGVTICELFIRLAGFDRGTVEVWNIVCVPVYVATFVLWLPINYRLNRERAKHADLPAGMEPTVPVLLPDNITVYYRPAPLARRVSGLAIDLALLGVVCGCIIWTTVSCSLTQSWIQSIRWLQLSLVLVPAVYFLRGEGMRDGQSYGKRWVNVRAIHYTGRPLTVGEALVRNALRVLALLPVFIPLELFCLHSSPWRQRLGDLAAGSVVVADPL